MKKKRAQRGQGMTEYILLVALIAIVCIAAVRHFGSKTKDGFNAAADAVGGSTANSGGAVGGALNTAGDVVRALPGK